MLKSFFCEGKEKQGHDGIVFQQIPNSTSRWNLGLIGFNLLPKDYFFYS